MLSTLWIANSLYTEMEEEANRCAPNETGGILLGYRTDDHQAIVATHLVGPGPLAIHERERFVPDYDYQEAWIAKLYSESGRQLRYLGDWHTHPGGGNSMSGTDRKTLKRIACCRQARSSQPIMAILTKGPAWEISVWCGSLRRSLLGLRKMVLRAVQIRLFADVSCS